MMKQEMLNVSFSSRICLDPILIHFGEITRQNVAIKLSAILIDFKWRFSIIVTTYSILYWFGRSRLMGDLFRLCWEGKWVLPQRSSNASVISATLLAGFFFLFNPEIWAKSEKCKGRSSRSIKASFKEEGSNLSPGHVQVEKRSESEGTGEVFFPLFFLGE